jgi:sugar-specific transcriptional regulator TrmB
MFVLNGNGRKVLETLHGLGFGEYEARAYFTLLLCGGEMKATRIARMSGVPQSRIYWALENLEEKNMVKVNCKTPKTYSTRPLEHVVKNCVKSLQQEIKQAEKAGRWLGDIAETIGAIVKRHQKKTYVKVFEPSHRGG